MHKFRQPNTLRFRLRLWAVTYPPSAFPRPDAECKTQNAKLWYFADCHLQNDDLNDTEIFNFQFLT